MRLVLLIMCACVSGFLIGCGGEPTGPVGAQSQVSGTVTNNGKPVTLDSRVIFFNKDKGLTLIGVLDSLGSYSLVAGDPKLGVPAGRYEVSLAPPAPPVVEMNPASSEYQKMMTAGGSAGPPPAASKVVSDIPAKFLDPKTSGLVFEVKEGPNTYNFDLSKL
jgi:hypothetical protein